MFFAVMLSFFVSEEGLSEEKSLMDKIVSKIIEIQIIPMICEWYKVVLFLLIMKKNFVMSFFIRTFAPAFREKMVC